MAGITGTGSLHALEVDTEGAVEEFKEVKKAPLVPEHKKRKGTHMFVFFFFFFNVRERRASVSAPQRQQYTQQDGQGLICLHVILFGNRVRLALRVSLLLQWMRFAACGSYLGLLIFPATSLSLYFWLLVHQVYAVVRPFSRPFLCLSLIHI